MPASRRSTALLLSVLAVAATGCGQGAGDAATDDARGNNGDNALAESDVADVLEARRAIDAACGSDGSGAAGRSATQLGGAVSALARITEQYPGRVYETGNVERAQTMTTVSDQVSEQLRRCGIASEADRLAEAADDS